MKASSMKELQSVATIRPGATGTIYDREPTPGSHSANLLKGNGVSPEGAIEPDNLDTVWIKPDSDASRYILKPGDVILMARGSAIRAGVVGEVANQKTLLATANFMIIRPRDPEAVSGAVIAAFLNSEPGKAALENITKGSVIQSIPASGLRELKIPVPSQRNQAKIVALMQASQEAYQATLELAAQQQRAAQAKIINLMYQ
ncbi:MAG: hypothetical protein HPY82_16915 [Gammaproteobacteria bacterium]|nr:hypothetical protein [Gammaproteobacteria bacterium]